MLFAGIDWSDQSLEYHLRDADGQVLVEGHVRPDAAGMAELYLALKHRAAPAEIGIAIEAAHGAWVQALLDRGYTRMERWESMQAALTEAVLPVAEHLQVAKEGLVRYLATALLTLKGEIAERERQITVLFDRTPEANWIRSLPGAGPNLAPALLACLGRDPERFRSVTEARALMGTAPVTKASGRSRVVVFRRSCWKFARRTLQLFANQSRLFCDWAQAFYQKQRASGHGHHAALRALAHK